MRKETLKDPLPCRPTTVGGAFMAVGNLGNEDGFLIKWIISLKCWPFGHMICHMICSLLSITGKFFKAEDVFRSTCVELWILPGAPECSIRCPSKAGEGTRKGQREGRTAVVLGRGGAPGPGGVKFFENAAFIYSKCFSDFAGGVLRKERRGMLGTENPRSYQEVKLRALIMWLLLCSCVSCSGSKADIRDQYSSYWLSKCK